MKYRLRYNIFYNYVNILARFEYSLWEIEQIARNSKLSRWLKKYSACLLQPRQISMCVQTTHFFSDSFVLENSTAPKPFIWYVNIAN